MRPNRIRRRCAVLARRIGVRIRGAWSVLDGCDLGDCFGVWKLLGWSLAAVFFPLALLLFVVLRLGGVGRKRE